MTRRKKLKVIEVKSCTECPLSLHGELWYPVCEAFEPNRRLEDDHEPDGPPPGWCPARAGVAVKVVS